MERHGFFIATDPEARQQYFQLRAREYQRTFGFPGSWLEQEDSYDRTGTILVCAEEGSTRAIAGARMNISTPTCSMRLPMEHGSFSLPLLLPSMNLPQRNYAEVSRLAVAEGFQNSVLLMELLDALHVHARTHSTPLVFSICPRPQARNYRILKRKGMNKPFHIFEHIAVPAQYGIEMRLCLFSEQREF